MKRLMVLTAAALMVATVNAMSLAEARGKTDAVIADPAEMKSVMKQLSAEDQKSFVAAVNEAIGKMPGSAEEKCAVALNVNRAALSGSAKGNVTALLAEIYATAPLESLALINESFAKDVVNRAADPSKTYTDEKFTEMSKTVVNAVNSRVAGSDDAGVRGGFAALMMVRASNGSPESLANDLADTLGADAKTAKTEWFPAALATPANYDPMLSDTDVEKVPDIKTAVMLAGPQRHEVLLSSLVNGSSDPLWAIKDGFGDWSQVQPIDEGLFTVPRTTRDEPWNPSHPRGGFGGQWNPGVPPGYDWQNAY